MDKDISKKSASDKGSERANARPPGGEYESLPYGPETEMLALHSAIGNQRVGRLLQSDGAKPGMIQAKLTVSQPGDKYEQEADRIADEVMRAPSNDVSGAPPSVTPIQTPSLQCDAISGQSTAVSPNLQTQIESLQQNGGEPLPETPRAFMQSRLGRDLSGVRVHRNSVANELAGRLHARAFTVGNDIVFGKGQYPVGNPVNSRLLTHELVHSLQQKESNQTLIQRELSTSQAEPVIELGAPEEGFQPLPDKDRIKPNSKLAKQLGQLDKRMRMLMSKLLGDSEVDPAETIAALIFSKSQFKIARRAAASYLNATFVIVEKVELDTAYAASWLDALISTLNEFTVLLREVATSRPEYAEMAKDFDREARGILRSAKKLRDTQPFVRGGALVKKARASVVRRLESEQKKAEQQSRIETSGLNQDLIAISSLKPAELMKLRFEAERELARNPDTETRKFLNQQINNIDQALNTERGIPEPNLVAIKDEMTTIESERTREGSANLLNKKLDQLDLATLAEDAEGKARLTNLGLQLAESTSFQAAGQTIFGDLGKIVTERWEEEKAIERISRAIAATSKPKEHISVTGEELTHLRITRSGDSVVVRKGDVLRGVEALDAARRNVATPKTEYILDPSDVVRLTWIDSSQKSQSVNVAAFALLYMKDKSINDTYEMWAMLIQLGVVLTPKTIKIPETQISELTSIPPSATKPKVSQGMGIPDGPALTQGSPAGSPGLTGGAFVKVPYSDGLMLMDNDVAISLAKRDVGASMQAGEQLAAETMDQAVAVSRRLPALTPTGARQFGAPHKKPIPLPEDRASLVISRPQVQPSTIKGLMKELRDAGVGRGRRRNIQGEISDRRQIAEAMIAGAETGKVPIFYTMDKGIIHRLARIAFKNDPTFINPDEVAASRVLAALESRGLNHFEVSIGKFKLIVRPIQFVD